MQQLLKKPEMQLSNFKKLITSDKAVVAASALLFTPAILTVVDKVKQRSNFLVKFATLALFLAAFVAFIISGFFSGMLQNIVFGISIGLFVNGLLSVPFFSDAVGRVTKKVSQN